jgi:heptosyltransferase-2
METLIMSKLKILVVQTAFPGDAILTLPMIQELKKMHIDSSIDVLCIPATAEIFRASASVNLVLELDKHGKHKSVFATLKLINEIKKNNYQKIYCPHRSFRSALITLWIGVKDTYGFDNSSLKFAFRNSTVYDYSSHEVKRNLSLTGKEQSGDEWKILPETSINEEIKNKIKNFIDKNNLTQDFVVIAPGSVWETKKYPADYYIEIIKFLSSKNLNIVLIGGKADKDLCDQITLQAKGKVINSCGEFSFIENIELLKHSKLLICNDSAPTHLGMCADIPVLTIYCSTVPEFGFYPYNNKSRSISFNELSCKPCGIHGHQQCPVSTFDCGKLMKPDIVLTHVKEMLQIND